MNLTIIIPELKFKSLIKKVKKAFKDDEIIIFKQRSYDICEKLNHFIKSAKNDNIVICSLKDKNLITSLKNDFRKEGEFYSNSDSEMNVYWSSSLKFNKHNMVLPEENDFINNSMEYIAWMIENNVIDKDKVIKTKVTSKHKKRITSEVDMKYLNRKFENIYFDRSVKSTKPKILLVCDVQGWAWWNKSLYLKHFLSDDFDFDIISVDDRKTNIDSNFYDVYFTYGYSYIRLLNKVPFEKRVTGVTAHRNMKIIKPAMAKAKTIHANSIILLNEVKKVHNNVFYVPNGVDDILFHPLEKAENREFTAGHVGKLCPAKGQKKIIEPAVKRAKVNYISNYNNFTNRISLDEMVKLYNKMDVFIVASTGDGTPNPGLESLACGVPVISNKIGNMPECIKTGYNGVLLNDLSISNYVRALKKFSHEEWKEMGKNGVKTIKEGWTWKIQAEKYREMFWNIINKL